MKKKMIAMITTALLCTVLGGNAVFANAPSVKAELTDLDEKVRTTCTSSVSETYKIVVVGKEKIYLTGEVLSYSQPVTLMGSGTINATHSAHAGCKFMSLKDSVNLLDKIYLGSRGMELYATINL